MLKQDRPLFDSCFNVFKDAQARVFRQDASAAYEELKILYKLDQAQDEQTILNAKAIMRSRQLLFVLIVLVLTGIFTVMLMIRHVRLKNAYRVLFRMNVEESKHCTKQLAGKQEESDSGVYRFKEIITRIESEKMYLDLKLTNQSFGDDQIDLRTYLGCRVELSGYDIERQLLMIRALVYVGFYIESCDMRGLLAGVYPLRVRIADATVVSPRKIE
jgi:hypothetical protein